MTSSPTYRGALRVCAPFVASFVLAACGGPTDVSSSKQSQPLGGNPAANLDQCANGPLAQPVPCTGSAWVNGNLNANQAHYVENQSVPYRMRFTNLPTTGSHVVTIQWDTTESYLHALDYLTAFDRTETTADPCSGVPGCSLASFSKFGIPLDPNVTAGPDDTSGTADDITQIAGFFTLFGGNITGVSGYTMTGAGHTQTSIAITFTASVSNPVLAWGGHISYRPDWRPEETAADIPGSPYHMRLLDLDGQGGNQDRSLAAAAIYNLPTLIVIKHVINDNHGTAVAGDFTMSVTALSPDPASFPGEESPGTMVVLNPGSYGVGENGPSGYAASYSADCTGTLNYDETKTCTVTNDDADRCAGVVCNGESECLEAGVCDPLTGQCTYAPKAEGTACTDDGNVCTLDICDGAGACTHPAGNTGTVCRASAGACDPAETCDGVSADCPADGKSTDLCRASGGVCDPAEFCDGVSNDCPADGKSTSLCRASGGVCDVPEYCNGVSNDCPADGFASATVVCRASGGVCDVAETCTGSSALCPPDVKSTSLCRASAGDCDVAESCNGVSNDCPPDSFLPPSTQCRSAAGVCDVAEFCTGSTANCPADAKSTAVCRASAGVCDVPESCDGVTNDCPADGFLASTTQCRASGGVCDPAEFCTGSAANCPADAKSTAVCRASAGVCDVTEFCDGTHNDCPSDLFLPSSTQCRASAGVCDTTEFCTGNAANCPPDSKSTAVCRASAGVCDVPESCDGVTNDCPADGFLAGTHVCRASAGVCDPLETCTGSSANCPPDVKSTVMCRASAGVCDVTEFCDGTNNDCPSDLFLPSSTQCRATAGVCDVTEFCTGSSANCPPDGKTTEVCRAAAGVCDVPESCDGVSNDCPADLLLPSTELCRASAGVCDVAEYCTGGAANCPSDGKSTALCRASAGECDISEFCDGATNDCPSDLFLPSSTACRASAGVCDVTEFCTGSAALCPPDGFANAGTVCRASTGTCDPQEVCTGSSPACPTDVLATCSLCGQKFYDANADGAYQGGEAGIAGWKFSLKQGDADPITASSDSGGTFTFDHLAGGDYTLCEVMPLQANWIQTAPPEICYSVHVPSDDALACNFDFGNLCLGPGGGLTLGFWSNKNGYQAFLARDYGFSALALLHNLNLRDANGLDFDPTSYTLFRTWLLNATATNMAYMLSAQLAAMELNVQKGYVDGSALVFAPGATSANPLGFATVEALMIEANAELGLHGYTPAGSPYRAYQHTLESALDQANNDHSFVQAQACPFSYPLVVTFHPAPPSPAVKLDLAR